MKKSRKGLLWKIKPENCEFESYLFGTIHLRKKSLAEKLEKLKPFIKECKVFNTEIALDLNYKELDLGHSFYLPDNQSLSELLGLKKYNKARKILAKAFKFNLNLYQHYIPLICSQAIAEHLLKPDQIAALDNLLWNEARKEGLICRGLETMSEQLQVLKEIPLNIQIKSFKDIYRNVSKFRKFNHLLLKAYEKENIQKIYKQSKKSLGGMRELMLYERNEKMAIRINQQSKDEAHFYAIGAGHLAGAKGVLNLLKKYGNQVKPIDYLVEYPANTKR